MLRSLGNKRKEIHAEAIKQITEIYHEFKEGEYCKIFDNDYFGYRHITIDRPKLKSPFEAKRKSPFEGGKGDDIEHDKKGNPIADSDLRDYENVQLKENIHDYFKREVRPHLPNAWIDETKRDEKDNEIGIVGYEINFTKYFYKYKPPRSLEEIRKDILALEEETENMISKVLN